MITEDPMGGHGTILRDQRAERKNIKLQFYLLTSTALWAELQRSTTTSHLSSHEMVRQCADQLELRDSNDQTMATKKASLDVAILEKE